MRSGEPERQERMVKYPRSNCLGPRSGEALRGENRLHPVRDTPDLSKSAQKRYSGGGEWGVEAQFSGLDLATT